MVLFFDNMTAIASSFQTLTTAAAAAASTANRALSSTTAANATAAVTASAGTAVATNTSPQRWARLASTAGLRFRLHFEATSVFERAGICMLCHDSHPTMEPILILHVFRHLSSSMVASLLPCIRALASTDAGLGLAGPSRPHRPLASKWERLDTLMHRLLEKGNMGAVNEVHLEQQDELLLRWTEAVEATTALAVRSKFVQVC